MTPASRPILSIVVPVLLSAATARAQPSAPAALGDQAAVLGFRLGVPLAQVPGLDAKACSPDGEEKRCTPKSVAGTPPGATARNVTLRFFRDRLYAIDVHLRSPGTGLRALADRACSDAGLRLAPEAPASDPGLARIEAQARSLDGIGQALRCKGSGRATLTVRYGTPAAKGGTDRLEVDLVHEATAAAARAARPKKDPMDDWL